MKIELKIWDVSLLVDDWNEPRWIGQTCSENDSGAWLNNNVWNVDHIMCSCEYEIEFRDVTLVV